MSRARGDDGTQPVTDQPRPIGDIGDYDDEHLSALAALVMFGRPRARPTPATATSSTPSSDNVEFLAAAEHALAAERARCRLRHPTARARLTV